MTRQKTAQQIFNEAESEKAFTQKIISTAKLMGWKVYHTWNSMHSEPGFPDLVMVRNGHLIFAEIKRERGEKTRTQKEWLDDLALLGYDNPHVRTYLWRPSQWEGIVDTLKGEGDG